MQYLFGTLIFLSSVFLILLILVQRGRGGGLAGAFGGMGGQSAFGTKAGDLFTRITIVVAAFWIVLGVSAIKMLNQSQSVFGSATSRSQTNAPQSGAKDTTKENTGTKSAEAPASDAKDSAGEAAAPETATPEKAPAEPQGSDTAAPSK